MTTSEAVAEILLKEKAVFLRPEEPFTWTSGIKSPVYCDNRLLISTIESRDFIIQCFTSAVRSLNVDLIAGTATAGIPWAAWIAHELRLPLVYIRSSTKDHGRQNAIEGKTTPGQKAVVIEDLISTGKSSISAAQKLQESGVLISGLMSIFTYDFPETQKILLEANLPCKSLTNFQDLAKVAYDLKMLDQENLAHVLGWRKNVVFP